MPEAAVKQRQISVFTFILSLISTLPVLHSYLSRSHPWTQTPADKRGGPAVRNMCESLCDSGSCSAPLCWLCRSGSSERPSCGTAAGRSCAQERIATFGSRMSNSHSWADAPDQHRICHRPAVGAPAGRCTWSCQACWCTGGHRAVAAARTHLCLPSTQRKTSTRNRQEDRGIEKKDGRRKRCNNNAEVTEKGDI